MTQLNNEFEKWFDKQLENENAFTSDEQITRWAWQAATAESDKRIAELNSENKQIDAINANLQAHINVLRAALEDIAKVNYSSAKCGEIAKQAIASTPAQSLQAHDDEVVERCAKVCDENALGVMAIYIRALKGK